MKLLLLLTQNKGLRGSKMPRYHERGTTPGLFAVAYTALHYATYTALGATHTPAFLAGARPVAFNGLLLPPTQRH